MNLDLFENEEETSRTCEVKVFNNEQFGSVRTTEVDGKILFCGKDIANALGYKEPTKAIREHCRWVSKIDIGVQTGVKTDGTPSIQIVSTSFIPEGDVYRLIVSSKLPSAEKFESWVFDEVLPSIRSNGGYIANQENLSDNEIMARALLVAQNVISQKDKTIAEQKKVLIEQAPKVEFYDAVTGSSDTIEMKEVAKILNNGIGRNKLFEVLRNKKILDCHNQPYQRYVDCGYFRVGETKYINKDGELKINLKTVVFKKGLDFIRKQVA